MRSQERRDRIVHLVRDSGEFKIEALAELFDVTASTIRRDIAILSSQRRVLRTLGGATALSGVAREPSYDDRALEALALKKQLARWAARRIQSEEAILIDAGSTLAALAREIDPHWRGTVTTTSLLVLEELAAAQSVRLDALGGTYRSASRSFVGPGAENALESMSFDRAFLSADGVSARLGVCEADDRQTQLKKRIALRARHRYVLAHRDKIGSEPFHSWAKLPLPWTLVTNVGADETELELLRAGGVNVEVVDDDDQRDAAHGRSHSDGS